MSVGPMGMTSAVAGTTQSRGNATERNQQDNAVQQRQAQYDQQAESAAGVGETAEDQESGDRDADGRRMWEKPPQTEAEKAPADQPAVGKDASGDCGNQLDLTG